MSERNGFKVIVCCTLIVFISMGMRQSFGLFLQPVSFALGTGREVFSLAIALQNLVFGLPLIGILADRFGSRLMVAAGGVLFMLSFFLLAYTTTSSGLYLSLGVMVGIALSGTSYVVVLGAAARVVQPSRRSTVFGVITAAGSLGMFAMVPVVQWQLNEFGWQNAFIISAFLVAIISALAMGLPGMRAAAQGGAEQDEQPNQPIPQILSRARSHSGYLLLNAGFFVCGFHVAFIATHLPAYLADQGVTGMAGAAALSMIGLFNILGSYLFGMLGDRYRKKYLLSLLYFLRAIVISVFLITPLSEFSALVFGGLIGFLWLATVPLTSGMIAQVFGSRYLSTLYGIVFFSHQIGSFLGVWLGGRLYDSTGSYTTVWLTAIILGLLAAAVHLPISDRPLHSLRTQQTLGAANSN